MGSFSFAKNTAIVRSTREETPASRRREACRNQTVLYVDFGLPLGYRTPVKGVIRWIHDHPSAAALAARRRAASL